MRSVRDSIRYSVASSHARCRIDLCRRSPAAVDGNFTLFGILERAAWARGLRQPPVVTSERSCFAHPFVFRLLYGATCRNSLVLRPNEFLIESLRSHSVLSLVWVLSALREHARSSFMYVGLTCFGYSEDYGKPDAEADLLAIVDGKSIFCQVKSAWRSLRTASGRLVRIAKRLRPDRAILAVMEDDSDSKRKSVRRRVS
jgi:hypothetical protein